MAGAMSAIAKAPHFAATNGSLIHRSKFACTCWLTSKATKRANAAATTAFDAHFELAPVNRAKH